VTGDALVLVLDLADPVGPRARLAGVELGADGVGEQADAVELVGLGLVGGEVAGRAEGRVDGDGADGEVPTGSGPAAAGVGAVGEGEVGLDAGTTWGDVERVRQAGAAVGLCVGWLDEVERLGGVAVLELGEIEVTEVGGGRGRHVVEVAGRGVGDGAGVVEHDGEDAGDQRQDQRDGRGGPPGGGAPVATLRRSRSAQERAPDALQGTSTARRCLNEADQRRPSRARTHRSPPGSPCLRRT
jgi:hypothetical protein